MTLPSRAKRLQKNYGLSVAKYAEMLEQQDGVCAVCERGETMLQKGRVQSLSVDHDHETGRVRGLLCHACNVALGMLREDPALMMRLALYITRA